MKNSHLLYSLYKQGTIDKHRFDSLQESLQAEKVTLLFYLLLGIGTTLLITGLLFFIAANWAGIPPLVKLFGIQTLLILSIALAYSFKTHARLFPLFVITASVLVGFNLAIFGQVYQTGADAYTLFATWTLLITLWAWFLKLPYLFMIWQVLLYLTLSLFYFQYLRPFNLIAEREFQLIFIVLVHLILALSFWKKDITLFKHRPNTILILLTALTAVLFPSIVAIFENDDKHTIFIFIFLLQSTLLLSYYHQRKSILQLSLVLLNILIFIEFLLMKSLISFSSVASLLLFGLITIALTVTLGKIIRKLNREYQGNLV